MTETDKAREVAYEIAMALHPPTKYCTDNAVRCRAETVILERVAAYGAAQYEAGAAQMRERAAERIQGNSCVRHCELCKTAPCGETSAVSVRALPLREKD